MRSFSAEEVRNILDFPSLIDALGDMFKTGCTSPVRHHHDVEVPGEANATLLLMPAWRSGDSIGMKMVNVFPGNSARGLPAISGCYLLSSGKTGQLEAFIDGAELTARRTAAASALAARYLAKKDASRLVIVGTGKLAPNLIAAHSAARPIRQVLVWGRSPDKAAGVIEQARDMGLTHEFAVETDLSAAVAEADIVSCATLSQEPLVKGEWLRPGTHVDLVGAFKPDMRESDDEAIRRASVFVDTRAGATKEGGDIVQPLRSGVLTEAGIKADLHELSRGEHKGRASDDEITLFKSVGASLEDLAAAILLKKKAG